MAMVASLSIGELFAANEVAFIIAIGATLEDMTVARARKGLAKLIALTPAVGHRLNQIGDTFVQEDVKAEDIRKGDLLRVLPGETIPADGTVLTGTTCVDQSIITGEFLPMDKAVGNSVYCGTITFDKTDTLTEGRLEVCNVQTFSSDLSENELLAMTAAAECYSEHPLGRAVFQHAQQLELPLPEADDFRAVALSLFRVLNPVTGALVHNAGSCLVVLNAALLYDRKFD